MRISVNARFLAGRATGVQRVARELAERLCGLADVTLDVPAGCRVPGGLAAYAPVRRGVLRGPAWEQLELPARRLAAGEDVALDPANVGPRLARRRVLILHDVLPVTNPEWYTPAYRTWFAATAAAAARRSASVVMFTEWARQEAIRTLGVPSERIALIPQGVSPFEAPAAATTVRAVLERFGIREPFVLALGAGDARKNAQLLVDVFARWRARDPAAPTLVLAGEPYAHVHAAASSDAAGAGVVRLGHVDDEELHALYTAARLFCFPSLAEGFGRPPLEAMACGTPVVVAPYGAAREVLGDAAAVVPPDADAWVQALRTLVLEGDERRRRIEAGLARARRFDWDSAAAGLLEICADVAAAREPATLASQPARRAG